MHEERRTMYDEGRSRFSDKRYSDLVISIDRESPKTKLLRGAQQTQEIDDNKTFKNFCSKPRIETKP